MRGGRTAARKGGGEDQLGWEGRVVSLLSPPLLPFLYVQSDFSLFLHASLHISAILDSPLATLSLPFLFPKSISCFHRFSLIFPNSQFSVHFPWSFLHRPRILFSPLHISSSFFHPWVLSSTLLPFNIIL
jgi:hypothetical protein